MSEPALLKVSEVARRLSVNPRTVQRLIARGELVAVRVGRVYRVAPEALKNYLEQPRSNDSEP